MNYAVGITRNTIVLTPIEKVRLILGLVMMFSGLYFGLFSTGIGESLGYLALIASPFVMVADKQGFENSFSAAEKFKDKEGKIK
jgi:hypothetical protein